MVQHLINRHWICGIHWKTEKEENLSGTECGNHVSFNDDKLELTLYTYNPIGPALLLHSKLLLSVLTFYYRAKIQEQQLIKQTHLQAIYETGSKLTHDVKNILQSTQTMTQIILDKDTRIEETREILKQQLPLLTQRLKTTLDKLAMPTSDEPETGSLSNWWNQLKVRYNGRNIEFSENLGSDPDIAVDVYNSIVENLLENARSKRILEPDINIVVDLQCDEDNLQLTVSDTGAAIPDSISSVMFNEPLTSEDGFGIGLYQSYQQANNIHLKLELADNIEGNVSFLLATNNTG
jgi:signal transduction histidine kinase